MALEEQVSDGQTTTDTVITSEASQAAEVTEQTAAPAEQALTGDQAGEQEQESTAEQEVNYDFKMPENMQLDEELAGELKEFAKEKNLSAEEAQKLVDLGVKMREKEASAYQDVQKQWVEQIKADQEIGGAQLEENIAVAKKALDAFGTPELKGLLNSTGFGNNPEVVRAFYKIGKAISEDKLIVGEGKPRGGPKDPAKTLFPNQG
jgi:hypothetical protein